MEFLLAIFSLLVFPGLVFISALAMFNEWFIRKFVAKAQSRMGPTYVGPQGILQPFVDLVKLVAVKEEIKQKYSFVSVGKVFAFLGIGALIASLLLLPLSPFRLVAPYDFLIYVYLCGVWAPIALVILGISIPNPFTSVGVSRLLSILLLCEPTYFAAVLTPIILVTHLLHTECLVPYSILWTSKLVHKLWLGPTAVPLALALVASIVTLQAKAMYQPFNIPEAEQELIAGFETEFSGPLLGLNNLLHEVDIAVTLLFITYLFLGGPYPYPHLSPQGIVVLIAKYLGLLLVVTVLKASFGRFRIEQGMWYIIKYGLIPAVIAIVIANVIIMFV